jgi:hypothetical protein
MYTNDKEKMWSATEVLQKGVDGTPGTIGSSMKFLYKAGYLALHNFNSRLAHSRYLLTEKGCKLVAGCVINNNEVIGE